MSARSEETIYADLQAAREVVQRLEAELFEARLRGCPVAVGMRVRDRHRPARGVFQISRLEPYGPAAFAVHGRKIRKDGTPGGRTVFVSSIDCIETVEA